MLHHQSSTRPCSCGLPCGGGVAASAFDSGESNASSLVDCTLSLGTPSTRLTSQRIPPPSSMSSCCWDWDILSQSKKHTSQGTTGGAAPAFGGGNSATIGSSVGGDPLLLARRCANCDTTSTPLWRNGPRGPKSLCNACGIRYKKEERRAAAAAPGAAEQLTGYSYHRPQQLQQSPWSSSYSSAATAKTTSSSISMRDDWRLNLAPSTQLPAQDRPSLFQYN